MHEGRSTHYAVAIMRKLPPLNALRAFEAAARLRSISAAANEIGVSHGAISQQVRQLERYFGQTLFYRPGRKIEPTAAALALLDDLREAFDRISAATEQLSRRGLNKIITMSAPQGFAMLWLIPRLARFRQDHPQYEVRISTLSTSSASALGEPVDFVIRREVMARNGFTCRKILDDAATPLMSPQCDLVRSTPARLRRASLLHSLSWPDAWRRWLSQYDALRTDTLDGPFFENSALSLKAAQTNLGVAIAPLALAQAHVDAGQLVAPFATKTIRGPGYHVLHRNDASLERGQREFLRFIEAEIGQCSQPSLTNGDGASRTSATVST